MTALPAEPRVIEERIPTIEEIEQEVFTPLGKAHNYLEGLTSHLRNAVGYTESDHWAARLPEPPTIEQIGTIAIAADTLDMKLGFLQQELDDLRQLISGLDILRLEGRERCD